MKAIATSCFTALLLAVGLFAADAKLDTQLDRAVAQIRLKDFQAAMPSVVWVMNESVRQGKFASLPEVLGPPQPPFAEPQLLEAVEELRTSFRARDYAASARLASRLGMSLAALAGPGNMPAGDSLLSLAAACRVAYERELWAEAQTLAQKLLTAKPAAHEDPSRAIHTAHTVLGLLALREGNAVAAAQHLTASVPASPGDTWATALPNFQLAAALLQNGQRTAVLHYTRQVAATPFRHPRTNEAVQRYLAALEAGANTDFLPLARGLR